MILYTIYITEIGSQEVVYIIYFAFALFFLIILALVFMVNQYYKNQQKFFAEKDHYQRQILETQVEVREEILQHVSREIHDNLGQITSLIKINLQMTELETDPVKEKKILAHTSELVKKLAGDMKELSLSLRSDVVMDNNLMDLVQKEVDRMNKLGYLASNYVHQGEEANMEPNTTLFLYRIFQEMVNNTVKHAKATEINICTYYHPPQFGLLYRDNGVGFNATKTLHTSNGSSGFKNIKERCKLIGAEFLLNSIPQLGTEITIKLDIKNER
jgi:two-component system NarL family sensor kinase